MTYHRLFEKQQLLTEELEQFRKENYSEIGTDRLRCQHCQGFYWRLWFDMAQCLSCQHYTIIELGDPVFEQQMEFSFVKDGIGQLLPNNLLAVEWVKEQLHSKEGLDVSRRIKDPLSDRTEFVIFDDRLRCRVTGTETLIKPSIKGYWIINVQSKVKGRTITDKEALEIVKQGKRDSDQSIDVEHTG